MCVRVGADTAALLQLLVVVRLRGLLLLMLLLLLLLLLLQLAKASVRRNGGLLLLLLLELLLLEVRGVLSGVGAVAERVHSGVVAGDGSGGATGVRRCCAKTGVETGVQFFHATLALLEELPRVALSVRVILQHRNCGSNR